MARGGGGHNDIYPVIDYASANVSREGETVEITGAVSQPVSQRHRGAPGDGRHGHSPGLGAAPDSPMVHMNTPQLFAGFWLGVSRPEVKSLSGKMVWANWDFEEIKGVEEEIASKNYVWNGFPFS
ncbi:hypothetical protein PG991_000711 [Apiospora marii]|uniref:Uncharacterized protein n=1 Tax=Apiospora marii TaxID=335849 RepID=A0ABR1SSS7_9PEZI